ncbi:MAG: sodium:solute symporter [Bacteroidia bacterium]
MSWVDWTVLVLSQLLIVTYGLYKSKQDKDMQSYLRGRSMSWFTVGLSIMATQASAITFLSAPGLAFTDGMGFIQFYFGLPIAMVILCAFAVPVYYRLNVYTAYEFLEQRFDLKIRVLAAFLFLTQRGLAAGFTIFAPSLILSSLLGWNIYYTNLAIGLIVILYTVSGGTKAVARTQKTQMAIILAGMGLAAVYVFKGLPQEVGMRESLLLAGTLGKLEAIDFNFDWSSRYNIWSGLIGGTFLMLSYFGTDQSQVQRYLGGQSVSQSRMGLVFNGLLKIPMQFAILFVGILVFVFYLFQSSPVFFNHVVLKEVRSSTQAGNFAAVEADYEQALAWRKAAAFSYLEDPENAALREDFRKAQDHVKEGRELARTVIKAALPSADVNDTNYIFLRYVFDFLPIGLIGLIISVIFSASMSSTSSELNALASTTVVDVYKRLINPNGSDTHYFKFGKMATIGWGFYAILFAMFANRLGTLIEAVNILGSLVYGTILGIFMVAFLLKKAQTKVVFSSAIVAQLLILSLFFFTDVPYLWYNVIGCMAVFMPVFLSSLNRNSALD